MSQLSLFLDSSLWVRDDQRRCLLASADQIPAAVRQIINKKDPCGALLTSPPRVEDYPRTKFQAVGLRVSAFRGAVHRQVESTNRVLGPFPRRHHRPGIGTPGIGTQASELVDLDHRAARYASIHCWTVVAAILDPRASKTSSLGPLG